ncbi:hypothetical protein C1H46_014401 [Malus baccata]|uniref:Uncharacterized protein n=1 Tax=Malus baccata TaxID=106549 RepID=A0A540MP69_MALBA|nr:hypothetical protein C1H46_014401 [Malus baccata]
MMRCSSLILQVREEPRRDMFTEGLDRSVLHWAFVANGTPSLLKSQVRIARFFRFSGIDSSSLHVAENGVSIAKNNTFTKLLNLGESLHANSFLHNVHDPGEKHVQTYSRCTMHLEKLSDMQCQLESQLKFITEFWLQVKLSLGWKGFINVQKMSLTRYNPIANKYAPIFSTSNMSRIHVSHGNRRLLETISKKWRDLLRNSRLCQL